MCRSKLFTSAKIISVTLLFSTLLISCKIEKDEILTPQYPLIKGISYSNPAVRSVGMKGFTIINVESKWEENFKNSNIARPTKIEAYSNVKPVSIHINEFNFTKINWAPTKQKVLMVAIFKNTIIVEKNEIKNKEDIVWLWNSPKEFDEGTLEVKTGKKATYSNGKFNLSSISEKEIWLKPGTYIYCIFVWDDYGHNIIASSREIPFIIYDSIIK